MTCRTMPICFVPRNSEGFWNTLTMPELIKLQAALNLSFVCLLIPVAEHDTLISISCSTLSHIAWRNASGQLQFEVQQDHRRMSDTSASDARAASCVASVLFLETAPPESGVSPPPLERLPALAHFAVPLY